MPQDTPRVVPEIPAGMMRVWDPEQKKVIFVPAPTVAENRITLTLRLHDAAEKHDAVKSSSWATIEVERDDLKMDEGHFIEKYIRPHLKQLKQLALTSI